MLVPARLVGMRFESDRPVNEVWIRDGTAPAGEEPDGLVAVLEAKFADDRGLPDRGSIEVAGGRTVAYTGLGVALRISSTRARRARSLPKANWPFCTSLCSQHRPSAVVPDR